MTALASSAFVENSCSAVYTIFARSNARIVGSNPTRGMHVFVCVYSVFVLFCVGSGLAIG
jgi:hypothetical protein